MALILSLNDVKLMMMNWIYITDLATTPGVAIIQFPYEGLSILKNYHRTRQLTRDVMRIYRTYLCDEVGHELLQQRVTMLEEWLTDFRDCSVRPALPKTTTGTQF